MQFKVARKNKDTGKWEYFGEIKMSERGYPQLEIKNTPELRAALEQAGDGRRVWFSLFETKEKSEAVRDVNEESDYTRQLKAAKSNEDLLDDTIPFAWVVGLGLSGLLLLNGGLVA